MSKTKYIKRTIAKYPFLKVRKYNDGYMYMDIEGEIPDGWWRAFGEMMCSEIKEELDNSNINNFEIIESDEVRGELMIKTSSLPKSSKIPEIIGKYSKLSKNICCECGKPDVQLIDKGGLISPYCYDCFSKYKKAIDKYNNVKRSETFYKNLYNKSVMNISDMDDSYTANKIKKRYKERMRNNGNNLQG